MKTERRHHLETNSLAETLNEWLERSRPYWNTILGVGVAVVLVAVAYSYIARRAASKATEGWNRFMVVTQSSADLEAQLENLAVEYDGTPTGFWSRLRLADLLLTQGIEELFRDRASGNELLRQAVEHYEIVAASGDGDLLIERAYWGLGQAHESLDELDQARESYQRLVQRYGDSALADQAKKRLAALDQPQVKEFYDWFAQQTTAAPQTSPFGDASDLESLPDEPPESSESGDIQFDTGSSLLDDSPLSTSALDEPESDTGGSDAGAGDESSEETSP